MSWVQISVVSEIEDQQAIEGAFQESGAIAVIISGAGDSIPTVCVEGLFESEMDLRHVQEHLESVRQGKSDLKYRIETIEDQDWARTWMDHFQPLQFGRRIWVCPGWHTPPDPSAVNIILDPGQAFGTGGHPTTALCLEWLDAAHLTGLDVIDYGCGSGILAIAAAKLGARHVWAVDNDPTALEAAQGNAQRNGVSRKVSVASPESIREMSMKSRLTEEHKKVDSSDKSMADVILANILSKPLMSLAPVFSCLLKPEGHIVLSGILSEQAEEVSSFYKQWFDKISFKYRDNWVLLEGVRKTGCRL